MSKTSRSGGFQVINLDKSPDLTRIVKTPGVCGGDACIKGTRLTVWGMEWFRKGGESDESLLSWYSQITQADLDACWAYAKLHPEEIEKATKDNADA
jgi:uncharacterized protein (DUF433 family)